MPKEKGTDRLGAVSSAAWAAVIKRVLASLEEIVKSLLTPAGASAAGTLLLLVLGLLHLGAHLGTEEKGRTADAGQDNRHSPFRCRAKARDLHLRRRRRGWRKLSMRSWIRGKTKGVGSGRATGGCCVDQTTARIWINTCIGVQPQPGDRRAGQASDNATQIGLSEDRTVDRLSITAVLAIRSEDLAAQDDCGSAAAPRQYWQSSRIYLHAVQLARCSL